MDHHVMDFHGRVEQGGVDGVLHLIGVDAQSDRGRPLGVEVHEEDLAPVLA